MNTKAITPILQDKALWVTVLGVLLQPLSAKLGITLDPSQVYGLAFLLVSYVVAHKWKSAMITLAEVGAAGVNTVQLPAQGVDTKSPAGSALKSLAIALCCLGLLGASSARAEVLVSSGPTLPLMEVRPGNPHPVSLAAGAGYQLSLTLPALQKAIGGKAWDLLDLNGMVFGSSVSSSSGQTFGALSAALGLCTLSSLLCVGGGHDVAVAPGMPSGWFGLFAFSFNLGTVPKAPANAPAGSPAWMPRGNTLYLGGW